MPVGNLLQQVVCRHLNFLHRQHRLYGVSSNFGWNPCQQPMSMAAWSTPAMSIPAMRRLARGAAGRTLAIVSAWCCVHLGLAVRISREGLSSPLRAAQVFMSASQALLFGSAIVLSLKALRAAEPTANALAAPQPVLHYVTGEVLRLALNVLLSWQPLQSSAGRAPMLNLLAQEAVCAMSASIAIVGPAQQVVAVFTMPVCWFLDWRHASLNDLPGCATLASYMLHRGLLLLAAKLFFVGVPSILVGGESAMQRFAQHTICLPLLGVQCLVSGWRVFNGVYRISVVEVWLAYVVGFGVGANIGNLQELCRQYCQVRKIACDVLPQHVVDTLIQEAQASPPPTVAPAAEAVEDPAAARVEVAAADVALAGYARVTAGEASAVEGTLEAQGGQGMEVWQGDSAQGAPLSPCMEGRESGESGSSKEPVPGNAGPREQGTTVPPAGAESSVASGNNSSASWCAVGSGNPLGFDTVAQLSRSARTSTAGLATRASHILGQSSADHACRSSPNAGSSCSTPTASTLHQGQQQAGFLRAAAISNPGAASSLLGLFMLPRLLQHSCPTSAERLTPVRQARSSAAGCLRTPLRQACASGSGSLSGDRPRQSLEPELSLAEDHPNACILFADVVGFEDIARASSCLQTLSLFSGLVNRLDTLVMRHPMVYKLDVVGHSYMVASGLCWHSGDPCPARTITEFGKLVLQTAATMTDHTTQQPLHMRVGIHKGPVVGALLGGLRRKYTILGDAVNTASRLESTSLPGAIHISAAVYDALASYAYQGDSPSAGQALGTRDARVFGLGTWADRLPKLRFLQPSLTPASGGQAGSDDPALVLGSPAAEVEGDSSDASSTALPAPYVGASVEAPASSGSCPRGPGLGTLLRSSVGDRSGCGVGSESIGHWQASPAGVAGLPVGAGSVQRPSPLSGGGVGPRVWTEHPSCTLARSTGSAADGLASVGQSEGSPQGLSASASRLLPRARRFLDFDEAKPARLSRVGSAPRFEDLNSASEPVKSQQGNSISQGEECAGVAQSDSRDCIDSTHSGEQRLWDEWQYRGKTPLKGRAPLHTYLLQVM